MRLHAAVVLAGGRATRLGGVDKVMLEVRGRPLLLTVVAAARAAGADPVVVVGPPRDGVPDVLWAREQEGSGPAAAVVAGLAVAGAGAVAVLAGDLPFVDAQVLELLAGSGPVGAVAVDDEGREQWLLGVHHDLMTTDDVGGRSVRSLLDRPGLARVSVPDPATWDCDTPEDLDRALRLDPHRLVGPVLGNDLP